MRERGRGRERERERERGGEGRGGSVSCFFMMWMDLRYIKHNSSFLLFKIMA